MARAGMALRRGGQGNNDGNDDVQRSIELLDRVLSEFDDVENANQVQNIQQISGSSSTPHLRHSSSSPGATPVDDDSPSSLHNNTGHHSEDDGYMSMNGRNKQQKFTNPTAHFKPLVENHQEIQVKPPGEPDDFPPPPEEAQRLIATLLPKVSPSHRQSKGIASGGGGGIAGKHHQRSFPLTQLLPPPQKFQNNDKNNIMIINGLPPEPIHTATQTTLPKTKHQRPYGWENNDFTLNPPPPPPGYRYGSLPYQHGIYPITSPTRMPPRTVPTAIERHREVKRHGSDENLSSDLDESHNLRRLSELAADDEHFSDDSLEEALPPPPPPVCNKRASIAWEVPLDDETLLTPGSTKVVGRRRRKSGSYSSTSSIPNKLKELEDWPEPPPCTTSDEVMSPFSDSDDHITLPPELNSANISGNSTYIIRRGKKERKSLTAASLTSNSSLNSRLSSELSIPAGRFSTELNSRLSTPNSRYSIDLSTPNFHITHELNSPKSRYSLDLNNTKLSELSSSDNISSSRSSTPSKVDLLMKNNNKHSTTFDNIKSLMREGVVRDFEEPVMEVAGELHHHQLNQQNNSIIRVVSLPSLNNEEYGVNKRELGITMEEEEDGDSSEISPLRKIEQNISELLERRDIELIKNDNDKFTLWNDVDSLNKRRLDLQKSSSQNEMIIKKKSEDYYRKLLIDGGNPFPKRNPIQKSESAKEMLIAHRDRENRLPTSTSADFPLRVNNDFPPLPPSPVEEDEDEYSEILLHGNKADTLPQGDRDVAPGVPPHRERESSGQGSLKSRSMDASYNRGRRNNFYTSSSRSNNVINNNNNNNNNMMSCERRTLPGGVDDSLLNNKKRPFQKRSMSSHYNNSEEHHLQTSCSLPETPIFARGCDIPRTPHRRAPEVPSGNQTAPRQSNTIGSLNTIATSSSTGGGSTSNFHRRGTHTGLEQAIVSAELLRLAGGPARGWYPKQRHRRPASIEHLDRTTCSAAAWEQNSRKPLTLPPNLTPKFFQRSPRDALRRVTSLLVKKGNNGKDSKKDKEIVSPTIHENANGEEVHKKKGFFKNFWKRSRHYSLEQQ